MKQVIISMGLLFAACTGSILLYGMDAAGDGTTAGNAAQYVAALVEQQSGVIAVYRDFGDGMNRFTQRAALNPNTLSMPEMDEKAPSPYGTSCVRVTCPFLHADDWKGFIFVTGKLAQNSTSPELDFGSVNTGHDLRGARRLTFKARGEKGGERLQFYMGGLAWDAQAPFPDTAKKMYYEGDNSENSVVTLSADWKDYVIDLAGLDLSRIGNGFGWVVSATENTVKSQIVFYLDEIVYEFEPAPHSEPLFLRSHEPVSLDRDRAFINNFAYVYDNALAAMVLARTGELDKACRIADAIVYAAHNDRSYTDVMLRNAYVNGPVRSFPGWLSPRGGEFAMIPGFYGVEVKEWWEDRYAVSINTGNIAWSILALAEVYRNIPQPAYLETAFQLGDYVLANFFSPDSEGGGFTGGYEGWEPTADNPEPPVKLTYKSTEHAIDLYVAFRWLAELAATPADAERYGNASIHARNFLLAMYDPARGCFYTGTATDGRTINRDNLPLDTNTWGILALLGDEGVKGAWDPEKVLGFIRENFKVPGTDGCDFNNNRDGVWFEGTAQYAVALDLLGHTAEAAQTLAYLNAAAGDDGSITAADRDGVDTGFDVTIATDETESGLKSIPWLYDRRGALGATCWLAFAQLKINPYASTGNAPVGIARTNIWSSGGRIHIASTAAGTAQIYTLGGALARTVEVGGGGTLTLSLPAGYYVVTLHNSASKVLVQHD